VPPDTKPLTVGLRLGEADPGGTVSVTVTSPDGSEDLLVDTLAIDE
jgi:hypothetical protein